MFDPRLLWRSPAINPLNCKARSIPVLNPIGIYGRVFFFSWFGFLVAFWSWYAFPPLLSISIAQDLHLRPVDIANSNIIALTATLLVRVIAGPLCDRFGPRNTFVGCLLLGALPTALAGTVSTPQGLLAVRFFIGILGGTFVPCQVWTTAFFDKNVVGTANALTAGLGNAGGGITYFLMPAIFDSLVASEHLTPHVAWRVSFLVPCAVICFVAGCVLWLCPDTPYGRWSDRQGHVNQVVLFDGKTAPSADNDVNAAAASAPPRWKHDAGASSSPLPDTSAATSVEAQQSLKTTQSEIVQPPTFHALLVVLSPQTLSTAMCYFCSFGAELALNSILGAYYLAHFPFLGQTGSGNWTAMFGLLNVVFRPLGGAVSDLAYYAGASVAGRKALMHTYGLAAGVFLVAIGIVDPRERSTMFGLVAAMAFFLEGANGAVFALVPHVHPFANGIVSGLTGAGGNLGGIIFAIIFRYQGQAYGRSIWIIGAISIAVNLALAWISPIPRGQVGGR